MKLWVYYLQNQEITYYYFEKRENNIGRASSFIGLLRRFLVSMGSMKIKIHYRPSPNLYYLFIIIIDFPNFSSKTNAENSTTCWFREMSRCCICSLLISNKMHKFMPWLNYTNKFLIIYIIVLTGTSTQFLYKST